MDVPNNHPSQWKFSSPTTPGLHEIVSPENSACTISWMYRLNLTSSHKERIHFPKRELCAYCVSGSIVVKNGSRVDALCQGDSLYAPGDTELVITAKTDSFLYIGAGPFDGKGEYFVRPLDWTLPIGEIHQIHGTPPFEREVFMTVNPEICASRLIAGITRGHPGGWTSWPPHQHTRDLEEIYCYFDIPFPKRAFHFSSREQGRFEVIHPVSTGDCVIAPEGYHPTVGTPGVRSTYFWVLVAHSPESRRYDLAISDPTFA
ncbi:MAG: myo-inositol catabolism protein [Chitinivibrionales bacterium]|nr:myo-inositol catabolism protein [Chitinivibrionales bacterium]MBD3356162.1 myo-inositol catabolism protein [Chitinivibrionales bacterium]